VDLGLSGEEVEQLAKLLVQNHDMFAPALHVLGQARHKAHQIEVEGHWPIKVALCCASPKELVVQ
jgi:hypothetical protein